MIRNQEPLFSDNASSPDVSADSQERQGLLAVHLGSVVDVEFLGVDRFRLLVVDDPHTEFNRDYIDNCVTVKSAVGSALLGKTADPEAIINVNDHTAFILHQVYNPNHFEEFHVRS